MAEDRITLRLEDRLKATYEKIGKKYYEGEKGKEIKDAAYQALFADIEQILNEKNTLEEKKLAMQGKKRCMSCQNVVPLESRFCNMCGTKLPEVKPVVVENSTPSIRKCLGCGNVLEADAVFCPNCGKKHS